MFVNFEDKVEYALKKSLLTIGIDPEHLLDCVDIVIFPPRRLLGFAWNGATVHVCDCTGTTINIYNLFH